MVYKRTYFLTPLLKLAIVDFLFFYFCQSVRITLLMLICISNVFPFKKENNRVQVLTLSSEKTGHIESYKYLGSKGLVGFLDLPLTSWGDSVSLFDLPGPHFPVCRMGIGSALP